MTIDPDEEDTLTDTVILPDDADGVEEVMAHLAGLYRCQGYSSEDWMVICAGGWATAGEEMARRGIAERGNN